MAERQHGRGPESQPIHRKQRIEANSRVLITLSGMVPGHVSLSIVWSHGIWIPRRERVSDRRCSCTAPASLPENYLTFRNTGLGGVSRPLVEDALPGINQKIPIRRGNVVMALTRTASRYAMAGSCLKSCYGNAAWLGKTSHSSLQLSFYYKLCI